MLLHLPWPAPLPKAYLAVDLFFVLSGFVIAHAYGRGLATGMTIREFCLVRLIRLYPLYAVATVLAVSQGLLLLSLGYGPPIAAGGRELLLSSATAILFLPTPPSWSGWPLLYPLDSPAWSLFWELAVNLLYAFVARWLRWPVVVLLIVAGVGTVSVEAYSHGLLDLGHRWETVWGGASRALFGFFAGVGVYRLARRWPAPRVPAWFLAVVLAAAFFPTREFGSAAYDLAAVLLFFPLLIWLGAASQPRGRMALAASWSGYMSYPLYILHLPIVSGLSLITAGEPWPVRIGLCAGAAFLLAWAAARWFDEPVRRRLRRRFVGNVPPEGAQTAP
jgi:peptidoglycan/LPS O-acetylase OafA/YrhL